MIYEEAKTILPEEESAQLARRAAAVEDYLSRITSGYGDGQMARLQRMRMWKTTSMRTEHVNLWRSPRKLFKSSSNYCNILRDDGLSYGIYLEQLTFPLFLKMADEQSRPPLNRVCEMSLKELWRSRERGASDARFIASDH
jgi:hypothetical protein